MLKWVKPFRDNSVQIMRDQPAQARAGLPMEEPRPAALPPVTAPRRGVFGAIRRLFKKKKNVPPLNTNQEGSSQECGGSSAEAPQPAVQPQVTAPLRGILKADRQLCKKKKAVPPLNTNQEGSSQECGGSSAEAPQPAVQPQVTAPLRGILRADRQLCKKKKAVPPLNTNQEGSSQECGGSSAEAPQPAVQPQVTAPLRGILKADRQLCKKKKAVPPLNTNQEGSSQECGGSSAEAPQPAVQPQVTAPLRGILRADGQLCKKKKAVPPLNTNQEGSSQECGGSSAEAPQPAVQPQVTAPLRGILRADRQLCNKKKAVPPLNTNQEGSSQECGGSSAEVPQPAVQPQVTAPLRGILRADRQLFKKKKAVPPLNTNQEGSSQECGGSSAEAPQPAVQPQVTAPLRGILRADRQLCKKKKVVPPLNTNQEGSSQECGGSSAEAPQPAVQPQVTAPRRGVFGAIRRLFKKKKNVPPLNTNQEGSLQEHGGSSAEVPQPAVQPQVTAPRRGVHWADRQLYTEDRVEPLNSNQERSAPERAAKGDFDGYNDPTPNEMEKILLVESINEETQVAPITTEAGKSSHPKTTEETRVMPITKDEKRHVTPSTNNNKPRVVVIPATQDKDARVVVIPSARNQPVQVITIPSTKDQDVEVIIATVKKEGRYMSTSTTEQGTQITSPTMSRRILGNGTPSNMDQKILMTPSTMDQHIQVTPFIMDQEVQVTPFTMDQHIQVTPFTMDQHIQVTPFTMDQEVQVTPLTKERGTHMSLSTKERGTHMSMSTKEQGTHMSLSTKERRTHMSLSTKERGTHMSLSTKERGTHMSLSTKEQGTHMSLSTKERGQVNVTKSTMDQEIQVTPITKNRNTQESPPTKDKSIQLGLSFKNQHTSVTSPPRGHGASPLVPSRRATVEQLCELTLERFTFHKILGEGAFGKVVLASHAAIGQKLAVKIIKKRRLLDEDPSVATKERQILINHKSNRFITQVFGSFQTMTHLFFVMEYLSGGDLHDLLVAHKVLNENIIRGLTAELICGLQYLHAGGVIHRDLKLKNILLDAAGHVRIADFGLSETGVSESNRITGCVGTLKYMAPEVLSGKAYYTVADYFSLGVIVYQMATGEHPYQNYTWNVRKLWTALRTFTPPFIGDRTTPLQELLYRLLLFDADMRATLLQNIRGLPFFNSINWTEVEKGKSPSPLTPDMLPKEPEPRRMEIAECLICDDEEMQIATWEQKNFEGFSYISESLKPQPMASSPAPSEGH